MVVSRSIGNNHARAPRPEFRFALAVPSSITRRQRARHHPAAHLASPSPFQRFGQFVETGAGRHHVVDQCDVQSADIARTCERPAHVAPSRIVLEPHLRRGIADALTAGDIDGKVESLRHLAGDFAGVVEAALADASCVQRHGNEAVWPWHVLDDMCQTFTQRRGDGELSVIFQARDHAVERKRIDQCGVGAVERGRVPETGTANLAMRGGGGALRALRLSVPGQVGLAAAADGQVARGRPAQQAIAGK